MINGEFRSPYRGQNPRRWPGITANLIAAHPLKTDEIVQVVLTAWDELHSTQIGSRKLRIGVHIFPNPQIVGFLLHEIIPVLFAENHPGEWRRETEKGEKDLVCIRDQRFSVEIKTSSHPTSIFGNRSYAQKPTKGKTSRKGRSGYFMTVNFVPFKLGVRGEITRVRFGWLDHTDWIGQAAPTGQQARLTSEADKHKLMELYSGAGTSSKAG